MSNLIVIEGIDGAGTTTQAKRLATRLGAHLTREPSDGPVGRLIREMLMGNHSPVSTSTMALLFAADRADHVAREVDPILASGKDVVSDRWYYSSYAYQGGELDRRWVMELNARARAPDLTIFLDVPPDVAAERRAIAGRPDEMYDGIEMQRKVAHSYREVMALLAPHERIVTLDGTRPVDEVAEDIYRCVAG